MARHLRRQCRQRAGEDAGIARRPRPSFGVRQRRKLAPRPPRRPPLRAGQSRRPASSYSRPRSSRTCVFPRMTRPASVVATNTVRMGPMGSRTPAPAARSPAGGQRRHRAAPRPAWPAPSRSPAASARTSSPARARAACPASTQHLLSFSSFLGAPSRGRARRGEAVPEGNAGCRCDPGRHVEVVARDDDESQAVHGAWSSRCERADHLRQLQ